MSNDFSKPSLRIWKLKQSGKYYGFQMCAGLNCRHAAFDVVEDRFYGDPSILLYAIARPRVIALSSKTGLYIL